VGRSISRAMDGSGSDPGSSQDLESRNSPLLFGHAGAVQLICSACLAGQMELVHKLCQGPSVQVPRGNLHLCFSLDRA